MITTNENGLNDGLNDQVLGGGANSFGISNNLDATNQNFNEDADTDNSIDENNLDDTEGGGVNVSEDDTDLSAGDDLSETEEDSLLDDDLDTEDDLDTVDDTETVSDDEDDSDTRATNY